MIEAQVIMEARYPDSKDTCHFTPAWETQRVIRFQDTVRGRGL
jgi:hypothetical protein